MATDQRRRAATRGGNGHNTSRSGRNHSSQGNRRRESGAQNNQHPQQGVRRQNRPRRKNKKRGTLDSLAARLCFAVFFAFIFLYALVVVTSSLRTDYIVRYEVKEGSLAVDNIYCGVAIRDEQIQYTQVAGHVNYYAREGSRVAKNGLVYIVDETGRLKQMLQSEQIEDNTLSNSDLNDFRSSIIQHSHNFDRTKFASVYECKNDLYSAVTRLANIKMLDRIKDYTQSGTSNIVNWCYAPGTGIVSYWTDGYESLRPEDVTKDIFEDTGYKKNSLINMDIFEAGSPAYKLSTNENWSLVIPVDPDEGIRLAEMEYIKVTFLKNRYESWGKAKLLNNSDGNTYLQLDFNNSMVTFSGDRFLDVELAVMDQKGLKIPNSSILSKEFFVIPEAFAMESDSESKRAISRQIYLEDGTPSMEKLDLEIYDYDSEEKVYYLDSDVLSPGDILLQPNGPETYVISKRATLIGVYNMNKGYAAFKQIHILAQNDEYAIVESNTKYGLSVYDYIVLNQEAVKVNQFIK